MKRYRWKCPRCGSGKLLGMRPRVNATDRFCLPCSEETGTLVERVCPVLETQREKAAAKAAEKQKQKRLREAGKYVVNGVDLRKELSRLWRIAQRIEPRLGKQSPPTLTIHRSKRWGTSGRAWTSSFALTKGKGGAVYRGPRIHLTCGTNLGTMLYVFAHEVAHHVATARGAWSSHGDTFKAAEAEMLQEAGIKDVRA